MLCANVYYVCISIRHSYMFYTDIFMFSACDSFNKINIDRYFINMLLQTELWACYSLSYACLWPLELQPIRLLCPWNSLGKNIGVDSHSLSTLTVLLGFLLPWRWGISSQLLQQSTAATPYLGWGVSPHPLPYWPWTWSGCSRPPVPTQPRLLGHGVAPPGCYHWPRAWSSSSWPPPLAKVKETQVRQYVLREGIGGQIHWNHNHRKLANLVTRTTTLSNSVKLRHAVGATQDGRVMMERSDRTWSTGEGNGKPLQYSCLENCTNSILRKDLQN